MGFSLICCFSKDLCRKDKSKSKKQSTWRVFSLKELHAATNYFNYDNKLEEDRFGSVYWGQLWDGSQIAVKRLKGCSSKTEKEFAVDVEILARASHKNLLSLRGYCAEEQERLLVYNYMPNLSLLSHLHSQHSDQTILDWKKRINIAIGAAEAIAYLHHEVTPNFVHGEIKASNVLLDDDFRAQVAGFGFSKLIIDSDTHVTTSVLGYFAPEYVMSGNASKASDVYSFGVLLLELVSGNRPIIASAKLTIIEWALALAREGKFIELADPKLKGNYVEEELKRVVYVALRCAQNQPEKRPTMLEVVELLKGESKEKLSALANDELFQNIEAADHVDDDDSHSGE